MSPFSNELGLLSVNVGLCCQHLSTLLPSSVFSPNATDYASTISSYWSTQEASLTPTCIVIPSTASEVSTTISFLSTTDCQFAIKSRGHAPAAGFANIDAGITIDMTFLSSVSVSTIGNETIAGVGAGASWLDVYSYLDLLGVSVAGGRNGDVGVGGLTLGGGISYFAPRVGWACDNVVNFEIVLPSGDLANANASSHSDLFRALKGGGNNFGVVTRFDLEAFPQDQILAGDIVTPVEESDALFKAFSDIAGAEDYDVYASIVMGISFNATSKLWSLSTGAIYTKPIVEPPVFNELLSIPNTTNTLNLTTLSTYANEGTIPQFNWIFYTGTYGVSADLLSTTFNILNSTLYSFNVPDGITWSIAFEPLPTVITQYGDLKGGNSLGTSPKDGNAYIMLLSPLWTDSASNSNVHAKAQEVVLQIAEAAEYMGLLHKFQYMNYADPSQHPLESYGWENFESLEDVSRKYDPKGMFQWQAPGGFKLRRFFI